MPFDGVARTAWLTARLRAEESARPAPLSVDPFAARLIADPDAPNHILEEPASPSPYVTTLPEWLALQAKDPHAATRAARAAMLAVRSRYFDDRVIEAVSRGVRTVVLVAAGLDTRVYRLPLPPGLCWIEVDRKETLAYKRRVLGSTPPHAEILDVGGDLRDPGVLREVTQALRGPSLWAIEGLMVYLDASEVERLLDTVAEHLDAGSAVLFDVPSRASLDPSGRMAATLARHMAHGSPWKFGTDDPAALVESRGLTADVIHVGHPRAHYGRIPWPPVEVLPPGQPTNFLVMGTRRA
jgi:methyltransferase (TIGR00027 family)